MAADPFHLTNVQRSRSFFTPGKGRARLCETQYTPGESTPVAKIASVRFWSASDLVISYVLQAGAQKHSYAMFFMRESDLAYLDSSSGWEVGVGPSITVIDQGKAASMTSTTAREGVYAIFFDQKGLMAGLGIQGSKITKLD